MNILNFLIESSICLALFISFYKIILSRSKYFSFSRFFLLASLLFAVSIPFINIESNSSEYVAILNEITINGNTDGSQSNGIFESNLNYNNLVGILYFLGLFIILVRFSVQLISLRVQFMKLNAPSYQNSLRIIETNKDIPPFSFFKTIVLGKYSNEEEKQHIITHESGHIKKLHSIDKLYAEIFSAIFWFNPFIWILKNELYLIHEYQADACTVNRSNKVSYMKTLVNLASIKQTNILINNFNQSFIKRRFKMITNDKVQRGKFTKLFFSAVFILGVGFIFACSDKSEEIQDTPANKEKTEVVEEISVVDNNTTTEKEDDSPIFTVVEEMPEYPGGKDALMNYLASNIKYPEEAKQSGAAGTSFVTFTVMKDGSIADVKLLRGFNEACDKEALRVVNAMSNWIPGKQKGKAVNVQFNIPIRFILDTE